MQLHASHVAMLCAVVAVSACSSSSTDFQTGPGIDAGATTSSALVVLNPDGSLPDQNFRPGTSGVSDSATVSDIGGVSGFAYQIGSIEGRNEFRAVAGIRPTSNPGAVPTVATAVYQGEYSLGYADRNETIKQTGNITLNADFNAGSLRGGADGLVVDGTISGQTVGGQATFRGVNADMIGVIGDTRAVTAFAGRTPDAVLGGGIIADRQ
ncbi:hypothetical protein GCM10007385_39540 [Tateyamaria omphalii]|uniref:hypothetical protein n=1 Tax=Tateyamaria omphalii TaxID=299262 RepID=UPI001675B4B4|nr:hypothetical protein [Tateyamaria omphalii]GGX66394.1 hypothetical protein GCM10007385_39540 [Tateyamaria omphalii]